MNLDSCRHSVTRLAALAIVSLVSFSCARPVEPSVADLVAAHVKAKGGRASMEGIKSRRVLKTDTSPRGDAVTMEVIAVAPNRESFVVRDKSGTEVFRTVFDGTRGWVVVGGETKELRGDELSQLAVDSEMFPELRFDYLYPESTVVGVVAYGGSTAYQVDVTSRAGEKGRFFFDQRSGLIVGNEYPRIPSSHEYSDFRTIDGIQYSMRQASVRGERKTLGTITLIEHNVSVDESHFRPPAPAPN